MPTPAESPSADGQQDTASDFPHEARLEDLDGSPIVVNVYHGTHTLAHGEEMSRRSLALLDEAEIDGKVPLIIDLSDTKFTDFMVRISDFPKIRDTFGILKRASPIWVVGAPRVTETFIGIFGKVYTGNRLQSSKTIDEARASIRKTMTA